MTISKRDKLSVLAWPRSSPSNVYTGSLYDALERVPGVEVQGLDYRWRKLAKLIAKPPKIFHIHWFERAFWAKTPFIVLKQAVFVSALTVLLSFRGTRLIWTAHDPEPHQSPLNKWLTDPRTSIVWRFYKWLMTRLTSGVLLMSRSHEAAVAKRSDRLARLPSAVVPHPHYRGQYVDDISRKEARRRLGINSDSIVLSFIGSLRLYKNPEGLIRAFSEVPGDLVLLVAGEAETVERADFLKKLCNKDHRIKLRIGFVPDDEISGWLRASDMSVLPYRKVTNSGSAHLALSFDVPVLVPNETIFVELQDMVGEAWLKRFEGDISPKSIVDGVRWAREKRPLSPDLSALDWDGIAALTLRFYHDISEQR